MGGIQLRGFRRWHQQMQAMAGTVGAERAMRSAARAAVKPFVDAARELAPVGDADDPTPGLLRASIKLVTKAPKTGFVIASAGLQVVSRKVKLDVEVGDEFGGLGEVETTIRRGGAGWRYHLAEFGSRHHAARPFIRPAWYRHRAGILPRLAVELEKRLRKAIRTAQAVTT